MKLVKRAVKLVLAVLIVWMVARSLSRTWEDLRAYGASLRLLPSWLLVSGGIYLAGLSCFGLFFSRIMNATLIPIRVPAALRAYLIGHLGKYVPGKALVVVLRVGLITPYGARPATAAFATLYETLVMMATGGIIAGLIFLAWPGSPVALPIGGARSVDVPMAALSLAVGVPLLVLAQARIFPKLAMTASLPFPGVGPEALPQFSHRLLVEGLLLSAAGWFLLGLSLAAVVQAMEPAGLPVPQWPMAVAAVSLATVAGFAVAIFPGGLVIREAVLTAALSPTLGAEPALVAALVLRLVWVVAELAGSAVLFVARPSVPSFPDVEEPVPVSSSIAFPPPQPQPQPQPQSTSSSPSRPEP